MKKLVGEFKSRRWGQVLVHRTTYENGALAILLELKETREPLATLSVNMYTPECTADSRDLPFDCFYVKTWNENFEIAAEALESGLFVERNDIWPCKSGFVEAPVWQLKEWKV